MLLIWMILTYIRPVGHSRIFWFAKMFIIYIFENVLNIVHFSTELLRRECTRKFKNEGKIRQKFYSNIKIISEVCYISNIFLLVLYNIMDILKILSCPYVSNFINFNTKN